MLDRFNKRPLSYSQLSSWEYNKDEWYDNYILNKRTVPNASMIAGNVIGDLIGTTKSPIKELVDIGVKEYPLTARLGDIKMIGFIDGYNPDTKVLHENKTSATKYRWNQRKADEHGQLTMYCLMLFLAHNIPPEDITMYLNYIPVIKTQKPRPEFAGLPLYLCDENTCEDHIALPNPPTFKQYKTSRNTKQVRDYIDYIHTTVADMDAFIEAKSGDKVDALTI
jgi:hypothetical protein